MATKKRESSRIEDPMKSVKVGNKYPYENIIQDLDLKNK